MIKNIYKQLWNQRKANVWIVTELFLVSIFLWVIADQLLFQYNRFNRPMGYDIENTYTIWLYQLNSSAEGYISEEESGSNPLDDLLTIFSRLRKVEGVEEVAASTCSRPYSNCNAEIMFRSIHGNDTIAHSGIVRIVSPEHFKVFQIQTPDGHDPVSHPFQRQSVLSKDLADSLKVSRGDSITCDWANIPLFADICTEIRYAETWDDVSNGYLVMPEAELVRNQWPQDISIRLCDNLSEDQRIAVWENIKAACHINNFSFFLSRSYKDIRKEYVSYTVDEIKSMSWYAIFLMINIFLGVIGTFWFRTQQRRSEIGLRQALGASRRSIFTQLITEGIILLAVVIIPTVIVLINAWYLDLLSPNGSVTRFLFCMLTTWLLTMLMIIVGIWYPAWQATKVKPADVLHEE